MKDQELYHVTQFLKKGNSESFGWLYKKHRHYMVLSASKYANEFYSVDDLINEACAKVISNRPSRKDPNTFDFKNYMSFTIRNLYVDIYRHNKRHTHGLKNYDPEIIDEPYSEPNIEPLMDEIMKLNPKHRDIMLLRLCGKQFNEIAGLLNIGQNTSTGGFRHARFKLASVVDKVFPE